ncbi:hypothetical protein ASE36_00230 [Rhizobium sp. Root274]|nr:hypothetical protein ASE36_00230 [Rhizobium sp. Root274]
MKLNRLEIVLGDEEPDRRTVIAVKHDLAGIVDANSARFPIDFSIMDPNHRPRFRPVEVTFLAFSRRHFGLAN